MKEFRWLTWSIPFSNRKWEIVIVSDSEENKVKVNDDGETVARDEPSTYIQDDMWTQDADSWERDVIAPSTARAKTQNTRNLILF